MRSANPANPTFPGRAIVVAALAALVSCDRPADGVKTAAKVRRIGMVARAPASDFWEAMHHGALEAAREAGVDLTYRGPGVDGDAAMQAALVGEMVQSKIDALVLGPADGSVLGAPLSPARQANIPVVIVDHDPGGEAKDGISGVIGAADRRGGELAAAHLAEVLKRGRVLVFRHDREDPSTTAREDGFIAGLGAHAELTPLDPKYYAGNELAEAKAAANSLLSDHEGIAAVFCPSENAAHGMVLALRERALNGKVKVIGFESSLFLVEALALGDVDAMIVFDPVEMGRLSVRTAVDALEGRSPPARQEVAVVLATRANMHDQPVKFLLLPEVPRRPGT